MDLKIDIQDGRGTLTLETTDTLLNNIFMSLSIPRGSWWFNPEFGSRLHELNREKDVARVAMLAVTYAKEALQWLVDANKASAVDAATSHVKGGLVLTVTVTTAAGEPVTFEKFIPVGA
ncbi:MAG: phage GP46 family protein [Elusimicrobia bacterium]|nr:phage GP46 family protein [Elusimicrobiota bacterium]